MARGVLVVGGPSGQSTAAQTFALWQPYSLNNGALVPNSTVMSGQLTAGQWNYVPLPAPLALSPGIPYIAATGFTGSFPTTASSVPAVPQRRDHPGAAVRLLRPERDGAGPLSLPQSVFSTAGSDPAASMPNQGSNGDNFWQDLQITTTAPAGASYRLWPNYPVMATASAEDTRQQTIGTEFTLSQDCTLDRIWFYSPPGVTVAAVPVRHLAREHAGGRIRYGPPCSHLVRSGRQRLGVLLVQRRHAARGDYKMSVYSGGGAQFYTEQVNYFGGGGPASAAGIVNGPLTAPNVANASAPGQTTFTVRGLCLPDHLRRLR